MRLHEVPWPTASPGDSLSPMSSSEKKFKLTAQQIRQLVPNHGACYATDRITVDGRPVGYMFRDRPDKVPFSGWTFMAGDESQEYADDPANWAIYDVNTICNYDPAIIPFLEAAFGSKFGRVENSDNFEEE